MNLLSQQAIPPIRDERALVKVKSTQLNDKQVKEFEGLILAQSASTQCIVRATCFSPNGKLLVLAGDEGFLQLYAVCEGPLPLNLNITWAGHTKTILDLSWSPSSTHLMTASMDKTSMLWSTSQEPPLMCFQHPDIVTSVMFHPCNSNFFITGSLDHTLRLWCIPNNRVEAYVQLNEMVTTTKYSPRGDLIFVGTLTGLVYVYTCPSLTEILFANKFSCRNRKGLKRKGKKVTGIEFLDDTHVLISTNDSRMRLFSLHDYSLKQKYKGLINEEAPIKATFSHNFMHVISGSDTGEVFIWNQLNIYTPRDKCWYRIFNRDRNSSFEYFKVGRAKTTTCAIFSSAEMLRQVREIAATRNESVSHVVVVTDSDCTLNVWFNVFRVAI